MKGIMMNSGVLMLMLKSTKQIHFIIDKHISTLYVILHIHFQF